MRQSELRGTGLILRLFLRRDWLKITLWLVGLGGLMAAAAGKFDTLYGTQKALATIVTTLKTPAMVSLFGPFLAKPPYSPAGIYAAEMMVFMGLFTAMMAISFAVGATRRDEDNGNAELLRAHAIGRQATVAAAMLELVIINVATGVLESLGLTAAGMTGASTVGNWLFGCSLAAFGLMFGAISVLLAQIAGSGRGATMLSYIVLAVTYVARMLTDVQDPSLTWWTVFGWIEKLDIYGADRWWPLLLMLALALIAGGVAVALTRRRDLGAGLLPERNGHARASTLLAGPLSLQLRLERTSLIAWAFGMLLLGASYESIFGTVGDLLKANPAMAKLLGTAGQMAAGDQLILAFAHTLTIVFAVVATIPAILILLRLNADEEKGHLELLHARGVSRIAIWGSYVITAVLAATISLFCGILGMAGAGLAMLTHTNLTIGRFLRAFVAYWPAVLLVLAIVAIIVALLPRLQAISWVLPIYGIFAMYLGGLFNLPSWAQKLTPYGWVNKVPASALNWGTTSVLFIAAVVVAGGAAWWYRQRDLTLN